MLERDTASEEGIDAILGFWFEGAFAPVRDPKALARKWFQSSPEQDIDLERRFGQLAKRAAQGELDAWASTSRGRLALIILLDQLPRSLHRGTHAAFAQDDKALKLCLDGIDRRLDETLRPVERIFFYMPLQHSENEEIQSISVSTFNRLEQFSADEATDALVRNCAQYALEHKAVIDRFGRFPHRNAALGRGSTDAEQDYLRSGAKRYGQ